MAKISIDVYIDGRLLLKYGKMRTGVKRSVTRDQETNWPHQFPSRIPVNCKL